MTDTVLEADNADPPSSDAGDIGQLNPHSPALSGQGKRERRCSY
jgi:hypothetical protein